MTEERKQQTKETKNNDPAAPAILMVDDNEINLQTLYQTLDGQGYSLLIARSGEDALRIAAKAKPDLILLDVMMPGIDGYETCARLKSDESTRNSVIIFLTALQSTREKVRGLSLGAVDFLTKPFDPDEIIARVSRHLEVHLGHKVLLEENRLLADQLEDKLRSVPLESAERAAWIKSLISSGESDRVEFKSTLRWNLKTDRAEKVIENSWLKSIVAFLNSDGGVLLIGVADAGDILGTVADRFDNDDKYLLHVNNRIREYIGLEFVSFINFQLVPVEGQKVLLVQCQPSPSPVFLKSGKDEQFYVRVGPGNRRLSTSEVLTYVTNRKAQV
jgi:putative two-component system response regulator